MKMYLNGTTVSLNPAIITLTTSALLLCGRFVAAETVATNAATDAFPVSMTGDAAKPLGQLKPIWRMFGGDEPNYATMKNGRKLIGELGALAPKNVYFRAHNLLTSGDGTPALKWGSTGAYEENADGNPIFNCTILDGILD